MLTRPLLFQVDLVLSSTKEFKAKHGQIEFRLFQKYQQLIHNDKVGSICTFYNFLVDTPLKVNDRRNQIVELFSILKILRSNSI